MKKTHLFPLLLTYLSITIAFGQKLDLSFKSPLPIRAATINAMLVQPDGKILLGGDIKFYGTRRVHNLIRIAPDGSLDETFSFEGNDNFVITNLAQLSTGEFVASAWKYNSWLDYPESAAKLIKINPDGSIGKELSLPLVYNILVLDNEDRILVSTGTLVRLDSDLIQDASLQQFSSNGGVTAIAVAGDKILVAGTFSSVNGMEKNDVVRLHEDGSVDNTFDAGAGTSDRIGGLVVQPDGKILLCNSYINSFNGLAAGGLLRLHASGSVDTGFSPPRLNGPVGQAVVTNEGIYTSAFLDYNGETEDRLFRLHDDGTLDASFAPVKLEHFGATNLRLAISDSNIIASRTQAFGNVFGLSKITASGSYDERFKPEISRYGTITVADIFQGKLLVAGDFIRMNGIETYGIASLSLNGDVNESFRLKTNKGVVQQVKVLDDDNVLVTTYKHFFKLNDQGDETTDFSWSPFKLLHQVVKFRVLPDNKIIAADPNLIYRLNADGSEDTSFDIEDICCVRSTAFDFDMQGENIIYGSAFTAVGTVPANRVARLTTDASVDETFDMGKGPDDQISLIKVLKNNEILVAGYFKEFDAHPVSISLVKLSPDGKLDKTFYNNLQSSSSSVPWEIVHSRRVEQLGSTIFFQHMNGIFAMTIDGRPVADFDIPAIVGAVSDIVALDDTGDHGRRKTETGLLYGLGDFKIEDDGQPAFILRMEVDISDGVPAELTTGVEMPNRGKNDFALEVYPHPVKNKLTFRTGENAGVMDAVIFDLSGRRILLAEGSGIPPAGISEIDLHSVPPGVYILRVRTARGKEAFSRFIKAD